MTTKVPISALSFAESSVNPTVHTSDNSGSQLYREFCGTCGSPILEYGEDAKDKFRYIFTGTFDDTASMEIRKPKGEFFCERREQWVPEVPNIFHKQRIHD